MPSDEQDEKITLLSFNTRPCWRTEPEIDAQRQKYLSERHAIQADTKKGIYPFSNIDSKLTRADIEWLLIWLGPVDWSDKKKRERVGLDLRGADLRGLNLSNLPLMRILGGLNWDQWKRATLEEREMAAPHLEGTNLSNAHLEGAILQGAHLEGADLRDAHLEGSKLYGAYLKNVFLRDAHIEEARLRDTHLEGARLVHAHLEGADLRGAFLDGGTDLAGVSLGNEKLGCALLVDVHWSDANLSLVDWTRARKLGDEYLARHREVSWGTDTTKKKAQRLDDHQTAVRAYRQLANAMRAQGMSEEAIPFAYRAQILQRKVYLRQVRWGQVGLLETDTPQKGLRQSAKDLWRRFRSFGAYAFSWFLDILAGYGYKPGRSLFIYILMIAVFATCYYLVGHLTPSEALIFSVTSFHGRGFLPGPFALGSPVTGLAAIEAVAGLFIEISFIATFTQRFFGR